jgi:uncharacterized protein YndB with AHSA1/START domain
MTAMTSSTNSTGALAIAPAAPEREVVITRLLNAPPALVFKAWLDPQHIAQWWGPNGFTTTIFAMDVRVGGVWHYIMHGPDGVDYPNKVVYLEIVEPERVVYWHGTGDDPDPDAFQNTVTFVARGDKTEVTLRALFATVAARDATLAFGAVEGGNQTLARLEAFLTMGA